MAFDHKRRKGSIAAVVQKKGLRLFRTGFAIIRPIGGIPMTVGIEKAGRDQELPSPAWLLDLFIHPGQVLRRKAPLLGCATWQALTCWKLAGREKGHGTAGLMGPEP